MATASDLQTDSVGRPPEPDTMMIPTRVYVGNLPLSIRERDIEDLFHKVRPPLSYSPTCP